MNGFVEVNFTKVTIDGVASSKYTCIKMHKHGYIYILDFFGIECVSCIWVLCITFLVKH